MSAPDVPKKMVVGARQEYSCLGSLALSGDLHISDVFATEENVSRAMIRSTRSPDTVKAHSRTMKKMTLEAGYGEEGLWVSAGSAAGYPRL